MGRSLVLVVEVVGGDVHGPARGLCGDLGLAAHELEEVPADGGLQAVGHLWVVLQVLLGGVAALAQTGDRIFDYLKDHPEQIPSAHRFLTYYLDTVGRVLDQYVAHQDAALSTAEVEAFQQKVRQTLPGLRVGFENQLARLMASGRFDAEADLQVMESLLKMEGLS